jgi:hypothetical protein
MITYFRYRIGKVEGPEGPLVGLTPSEGPHGPSGTSHAYMGLGHQRHKAHAANPRETLKGDLPKET